MAACNKHPMVSQDLTLLPLPPAINRDNVDRVKTVLFKSYENQVRDLTEDNYYDSDALDLRIAAELKKRLDREFRSNFNVVVGLRFGASLGFSEDATQTHNSFIFEDKTKYGMKLYTLVFESNVREVAFTM